MIHSDPSIGCALASLLLSFQKLASATLSLNLYHLYQPEGLTGIHEIHTLLMVAPQLYFLQVLFFYPYRQPVKTILIEQ